MNRITIAAALLAASPALAGGNHGADTPVGAAPVPAVVNQGGAGGAGGTARANATSTATQTQTARGGNASAVVNHPGRVETVHSGAYRARIENTPTVATSLALGSCMGGASIGGSGPGLGLTLGIAKADGDCVRQQDVYVTLQLAEAFQRAGDHAEADRLREAARQRHAQGIGMGAAMQAAATTAEPMPTPSPEVAPPAQRPEWCAKARPRSQAARDYVRANCGGQAE